MVMQRLRGVTTIFDAENIDPESIRGAAADGFLPTFRARFTISPPDPATLARQLTIEVARVDGGDGRRIRVQTGVFLSSV
jgi:hypothetical protein